MVYKRPETAATCPNKQFRNKSLFSLPICQEEINKVIFVWVYELENNFIFVYNFVINRAKIQKLFFHYRLGTKFFDFFKGKYTDQSKSVFSKILQCLCEARTWEILLPLFSRYLHIISKLSNTGIQEDFSIFCCSYSQKSFTFLPNYFFSEVFSPINKIVF